MGGAEFGGGILGEGGLVGAGGEGAGVCCRREKRLVSFFPSLSRGDVAVVAHTGLAKEAFLGGVSRFLTGRISAFVLLAERSFAGRFHIAVVDETFPRHVFLLFSTFLFQINQTGDSRMLTDGA